MLSAVFDYKRPFALLKCTLPSGVTFETGPSDFVS